MGKIFCLMGKSGSGKDTVFSLLINDRELGLKPVVTYTTRPLREGEKEGIHYHFISEKQLGEFEKAGKIIEKRRYNTVKGIWYYCTVDDGSLDPSRSDYLMIVTLEAYMQLKAYYGSNKTVPLYLEVDDETRLKRAAGREDARHDREGYAEMLRRFEADKKDFSLQKIREARIRKIYKNYDLTVCVSEIKQDILKKIF